MNEKRNNNTTKTTNDDDEAQNRKSTNIQNRYSERKAEPLYVLFQRNAKSTKKTATERFFSVLVIIVFGCCRFVCNIFGVFGEQRFNATLQTIFSFTAMIAAGCYEIEYVSTHIIL